MVFAPSRKCVDYSVFESCIAGTRVERVESFRYLGLLLDPSLSWRSHVDYVAKKIASLIGGLFRVRHYLHPRTLLAIYYAQINSHLLYMAHAWGAACPSYMRSLQILQNKAMRLLFFSEYRRPGVHTLDLYVRHKILPVGKLAEFAAVVSIFKMKNQMSHSKIRLVTNSDVHHYATRQQSLLHLPQPHNRWGKDTLAYRGALLFNLLPPVIRNLPSLPAFKKSLKLHYLDLL